MSGLFEVLTDDGLTSYEMIYKVVGADAVAGHYLTSAVGTLGLDGVARILTEEHGVEAVRLAFGLDGGEVALDEPRWRLPVGEGEYPARDWYVASIHDPWGSKRQPIGSPRRHLGVDVNFDKFERGDVEIRLGLHAFAMNDGDVVFAQRVWDSGTDDVVVIKFDGSPYYWRYGHLLIDGFGIEQGKRVTKGQMLGLYAPYSPDAAHLHFDTCKTNPGGAYSVTTVAALGLEFIDPAPLLRDACGVEAYDAMARRGD